MSIKHLLWIFALGFSAMGNLPAAQPVRVTPINPAEAVIAPFWDYDQKEISNWNVTRGTTAHPFGAMDFYWKSQQTPGNTVFSMERPQAFSCAGYDQLIACLRIPQGETLKITLDTDQGRREQLWIGKSPVREEYRMPLGGAKKIDKITLEIIQSGNSGVTKGSILWLGLQNTDNLKIVQDQIRQLASQPLDRFMAPPEQMPKFEPKAGLLGKGAALKAVQEEYQRMKKAAGKELITENIGNYDPAALMGDTLPFANQHIFGRVRDDGRNFKSTRTLLQKALITKNADLMRMAVKNALIFALTPNWDTSFLSDFPDSGWEQRVFSNAVVAEDIALVLDYADDLLTEAGRQLLLKRLTLDGLGQINFNIWKHRYLFGNNQLSVFSRGRIAAYLMLENARNWNGPRVKPYTELALQELNDSIELLMYPDGSFLEGPGYFFYTVGSIQPALQMYANVRGKTLQEVIPSKMKSLGAFADTLISTDRRGGLIPFSSSQGEGRGTGVSTYQFLAAIAPDSQWTTLYNNLMRERYQNTPMSDLGFWTLRSQVPQTNPPVRPFSELPVMGAMSSTRFLNGSPVKLLMLGTKANCRSHRHNDKGSFVLEFDGDTYAADPGGQNYADADGKNVIRADYHNMLVPLTPRENEKETVSPVDIRPNGKGDKTSFRAEIHPAPASNGDLVKWTRVIDSPTPAKFIITDTYQTAPNQKGVRFLWITELPWKQLNGNTIRLDGKNSYALIHFPKDLKFSADTLMVRRKEKFNRLNFAKEIPEGKIRMEVELFPK